MTSLPSIIFYQTSAIEDVYSKEIEGLEATNPLRIEHSLIVDNLFTLESNQRKDAFQTTESFVDHNYQTDQKRNRKVRQLANSNKHLRTIRKGPPQPNQASRKFESMWDGHVGLTEVSEHHIKRKKDSKSSF